MLKSAIFPALVALGLFATADAAIGPVSNLNVVNKVIAPDGFNRSTVLAGDTFPGPLIQGSKGTIFAINVIDLLTDNTMERSTSIASHWHGILQNGTNWADGTSFVTQCPITANHSFLYSFDVGQQAGTFWYHSHFVNQYCDGLRGPFVVYDPSDPHRYRYDVDDESTIITVGDWYHVPSPLVGIPPIPDSTLINGKGRFAGGPPVPLSIVNVQRGKRYRFRLISISCDSNYIFSIDDHRFTIIEADAQNTQPLAVDSIQIFAGQRYSFILEANQPIANYWIRALPNNGRSIGFANGINSAILRYRGAPAKDPTTNQVSNEKPLKETDLHPLSDPGAPGAPNQDGADIRLNFDLDFNATSALFLINGVSYVSPTVPVLLQILSGARRPQDLFPTGSVYTLPRDKVVELSIPAGVVGGPHPFHLHGHAFDVVRSAGSTTYNYADPVRRDVVSIGDTGDNVTIRFRTDNSGPLVLHCHIEWHLTIGLAVVFAEDPENTKAQNPIPAAWEELCPIYGSLTPDQLAVNTAS